MNTETNNVLKIFIKHYNAFSEKAYVKLTESNSFRYNAQIYHYTSLQSLQKIIESQSFRATNIFMLNDPNELIHGSQQLSNWFISDIIKRLLHRAPLNSFHEFPVFVFSMTELNDDMHCWEKYGDKHRGIRIGFTPENLVEYWRKLEHVQVVLAPVIYHTYDQNFIGEYAEYFIQFKIDFVQEINNYISKNGLNEIDESNIKHCSTLIASMIKRKEWALEKEWRIICIPIGYLHESIIGDFSNGVASARLENKYNGTLDFLTNRGHDNLATKDVLKIGSLASDTESVRYALQLLFKRQTGQNYFNEIVTQSSIVTR